MRLLLVVISMTVGLLAAACVETQEPDAEPGAPGPTETPPAGVAEETPTPTVPAGTVPPADEVDRQVEVSLEDPGGSGAYAFDPNEFTFTTGETVEFVLTSETEFHTFTVDQLGIDVDVDARETVTYTHTFDQPGTFQLICIPHEALGMVGTITVQQ